MELIKFADDVLVAVEDADPTRSHQMRPDATQVMAKFSGVARELRERIDQIGTELKQAVSRPAELEVEFGVEIESEAGLPVIVKGRANCHIVVTATWRNDHQ